MKLYECQNCGIIQNNPWFKKKYLIKYTLIYMDSIIDVGQM